MEQPQAGNYLWGCVFSPRDPRAKRLVTRVRIALQTPTVPQLTWFCVVMGNTQGSRGFIFILLIGKQARRMPERVLGVLEPLEALEALEFAKFVFRFAVPDAAP